MSSDEKSCTGEVCVSQKKTEILNTQNSGEGDLTIYVCPMHLEIRRPGPGSCPICGMNLEPETITQNTAEVPSDFQRRLWVSVFLTTPLLVLTMGAHLLEAFGFIKTSSTFHHLYSPLIEWILATPVVFWTGGVFFKRAFDSARQGHVNMFTLISLGVSAAYGYSVAVLVCRFLNIPWPESSIYFEPAAVVICFVLLGQWLEEIGRDKANKAILHLLNLSPEFGYRVVGNSIEKVLLSQIQSGDLLRVRPGERVPVDGVITEGSGFLNEAMMTGEAFPVRKKEGDPVIGGTLNGEDSFTMKAVKVGQETLLASIIGLVITAQRTKAPIQQLVDKVASHFVPLVIATSFFAAMAWIAWGQEAYAVTAGVAVLIIACPCALGLATPLSIMMATGRGARSGILTRRAEDLERMASVDTIVFDKTGTLTVGKPMLQEIVILGSYKEEILLALAAGLETHSAHPLATSIIEAAKEKDLELKDLKKVTFVPSKGLSGTWEKNTVLLGNSQFMEESGVDLAPTQSQVEFLRQKGQTIIFMGINKKLEALLAISDPLKPSGKDVVQALMNQGMKVLLLTGDHESTARGIASRLGIQDVKAGVLPDQKYTVIKQLQEEGHKVAMVGDGINDAPALMQADVGIAMGTGTDAAMESAGITLISGDLKMLLKAQLLSKNTMKNIKQNLFFAFGYNVLAIPIAAGGLYPLFGIMLDPMIASLAMALSSVSVIWNSYRLKNSPLEPASFTQTLPDATNEKPDGLGSLVESQDNE